MELVWGLLAGTVLGILTGLGVGGGSLLLLYLTFFTALDMAAARTISLLFFFPAAGLSAFRPRKQQGFQALLPAIFSGVLSAALGSILAGILSPAIFRKALGLLFLFLGFYELFYKQTR